MTTKEIQCLLYVCGYDPGPIDGINGPKTQAALNAVKYMYGVGADGLVGILAGTVPKIVGRDSWWSEIRYFKKSEFKCKCGKCKSNVDMKEPIVRVLDDIRMAFDRPALVSSGIRCDEHNLAVGGVKNSKHLTGEAVDFCVVGISGDNLIKEIAKHKEVKYSYVISGGYCHMNI